MSFDTSLPVVREYSSIWGTKNGIVNPGLHNTWSLGFPLCILQNSTAL